MKIMLLAPGISIHSQRFLHMLLDSGHDVTFVDSFNPVPYGVEHYQFIHYPSIFGLDLLPFRTGHRLGNWLQAEQLRLIWRRIKPDIVHLHWVDVRAHHCTLAKLSPLIFTCWGSDINNLFSEGFTNLEYRAKIAEAIQKADYITADSAEVISRCEKLAGRKVPSNLFFFGIDLAIFAPRNDFDVILYKEKLGIPSQHRVILSARALRPLMGHHWVLESFARIAHNSNFLDTVLILKRYLPFDDGYEKSLKIRIRELQLDERVIWLNPPLDDEMPLLYGIADVVVNFPERDGFPVTFFEAAACRRPIVSSDLPAYSGIITEDECWLVPPGDVEALEKGLIASLSATKEEMNYRLDRAISVVKTKGEQHACFSMMETIYQSLYQN